MPDVSEKQEVKMQWGVRIPLRDGIHANATLYLPEQHTSSPAIFVLTPYVGQVHHDQGVYFASYGYPYLTIDVRGRGNSEGTFHPLSDAKDGYDIVEWIARQPWCNGKVAMWGGSYSGYTQWATAKEHPPHLATIVPTAAPYRGVDSPVRNNIFKPYTLQWLTMISGRTLQDKMFWNQEAYWGGQFRRWFESGAPLKELDEILGNPSELFQEWLSHPHRSAYWDAYNPTGEQYAGLDMPVLSITGSYDGDQLGSLAHYREHMRSASPANRARHYLVIGPWDHAGTRVPKAEFGGLKVGPESLIDIGKLHRDWYAWTLQGGPKPEFLKKNVAYYVMGSEKWRYADTLEAITTRSEPYYLDSTINPLDVFRSGTLASNMPTGREPDSYVYDPRDLSGAELEAKIDPSILTDQRMVHAQHGKRLVYHSAPFEKDTEVSGFFKLSAWLSIDQPDTDFTVSVYEIDLNGGSLLLSNDSMRARYRESFREEKLIRTTEPLRYDFDGFMFVSRLIRKGHRLRLTVGPINSIYSQKNYNAGGVVAEESVRDARAVTVRLFHDGLHPSTLYVPLGAEEERD